MVVMMSNYIFYIKLIILTNLILLIQLNYWYYYFMKTSQSVEKRLMERVGIHLGKIPWYYFRTFRIKGEDINLTHERVKIFFNCAKSS